MRGKRSIFVGRAATIEPGCSIDGYARNGVRIGDRAKLGAHTIVSCTGHLSRFGVGLRIGNDSGIGEFGYVGAAGGVTIGDDVIMGQYVSFHSQEHNHSDPDVPIRLQGQTEKGISIGDNCWVGARVTFLDGASIGSGCVVAAGAVVRGAFPERTVLGGVPAREIRRLSGEKAPAGMADHG